MMRVNETNGAMFYARNRRKWNDICHGYITILDCRHDNKAVSAKTKFELDSDLIFSIPHSSTGNET